MDNRYSSGVFGLIFACDWALPLMNKNGKLS